MNNHYVTLRDSQVEFEDLTKEYGISLTKDPCFRIYKSDPISATIQIRHPNTKLGRYGKKIKRNLYASVVFMNVKQLEELRDKIQLVIDEIK